MNTAMKLYDAHFYGKQVEQGIDQLKGEILKRDDFTSKIMPNGYERVTFLDDSILIFTHDNVQVSLF